MRELGIGELARRSGIAASALRYYEALGILPPAPRVSGRRRYDERAVRTVAAIRAAQDAGFSLHEIGVLFRDIAGGATPGAGWRKLALRKLEELDALERRVRLMKATLKLGLECGCLRLDDCRLIDGSRPAARRARP